MRLHPAWAHILFALVGTFPMPALGALQLFRVPHLNTFP
jgi:hypothetical protein